MNCARIRRLIEAYVDGAASGAERQAVDEHLARCAACARGMVESRQVVGLLASMPERRVSASFEANLMAAVRQTAPASEGAAWWERFRLRFEWRLRVPALVTAGSLAAGVCAFLIAPRVQEMQQVQETRQEQRQYVAAVVEQHQQLEHARSRVDPDVVEASIDLSTGSVLTE